MKKIMLMYNSDDSGYLVKFLCSISRPYNMQIFYGFFFCLFFFWKREEEVWEGDECLGIPRTILISTFLVKSG